MDDYLSGLDRAMKRMPDSKGPKERFVMPTPRVFYEGKATVLENFGAIADAFDRDPDHLMKYLLQELGTAGKIEGHRASSRASSLSRPSPARLSPTSRSTSSALSAGFPTPTSSRATASSCSGATHAGPTGL
jgi:hypothetical protein